MTNKIGIIGAGISGLTLGCLLAKGSKNCTIYEKADGPSNYGAGISLSPNIIRLLDELEILEKVEKETPIEIIKRSRDYVSINNIEFVLYDTAGRINIDNELLEELNLIESEIVPNETILVLDSLTGQEAMKVATDFATTVKVLLLSR
mgnify:CR=1 FL=1